MKKQWWGLVVLVLLASVILRHSLLFLMGLLLALVGGVSYFWTRTCLVGVTYRRRLGTDRLFPGEETELALEVVNAKPLPLAWLRAEDEMPSALELVGGREHYSHLPGRRLLINLLSLRWYERVTRHYQLRGLQRGAWALGPLRLESGDIFGLGSKCIEQLETQLVLVYPRLVPLTALGLPARHPFGDWQTPRRLVEDPLRMMGAREYRPGDSIRHIHWKASARQQGLQTKIFDPSASRPLALFLNINTFAFIYEGLDRDLQEFAITTAASIARYAWEQGQPVGLYVNAVAWPGGQRIRIAPGQHPEQLLQILEALARVVEHGRWPLEAVLQVESGHLPYGATIVAITPQISAGLCTMLAELQHREYAVSLVALGDAHLDAPLPGVQYYHIGGHEVWDDLKALRLA